MSKQKVCPVQLLSAFFDGGSSVLPPPLKSVSLILKNVQVINMKWLTDVNASEEIPAPVKEKKEKETRKRSILQYRRSALAVAPLALQVGVVLGQSSHG